MDAEQVERLLSEDSYTKSIVVGVLAKDCLPKTGIVRYPAAFVCNTQASDKLGQHRICMFFTNDGRGEYFDSYGLPPRQGEFVYFLENNSVTWSSNEKTLQNPLSNVCGQFCVMYLLHRCRGLTAKTIVNGFGNVLVNNDCRVFDFVNSCMQCLR